MLNETQLNDLLKFFNNYSHLDLKEYSDILLLLKEVNSLFGNISPDIQQLISDHFKIKLSYIKAILKKNPSINNSESVEIVVCLGPRCMKKNAYQNYKTIKRICNIDDSNVNNQKNICVKTKNCMKLCMTSPNITINGKHFKNVSEKKLEMYFENIL